MTVEEKAKGWAEEWPRCDIRDKVNSITHIALNKPDGGVYFAVLMYEALPPLHRQEFLDILRQVTNHGTTAHSK